MIGTPHHVGVERDYGRIDAVSGRGRVCPVVVTLANEEDGFYWQGFESRAEVDEFVAKLVAARDEAFPLPAIEGSRSTEQPRIIEQIAGALGWEAKDV